MIQEEQLNKRKICLGLIALSACYLTILGQQDLVEKATGYYPVTFFELMNDPGKFDGRNIEVFGYLDDPYDDAVLFPLKDYAEYGQIWYGLAVVYKKDVKIMSEKTPENKLRKALKKVGWKYVAIRGKFVNKRHGLIGSLFGAIHVDEVIVPPRYIEGKKAKK